MGFGIAVVTTSVLGMVLTRLVGRRGLAPMSRQGIAVSWGNVGYMAVLLCLAAFGEPDLPPAMLTVIVTAIVAMVFGIMDPGSVPGRVAFLMAALPTAANAFVLARKFDIAIEQNSAAVLLSTAFSVIMVSALLVWLRAA